MTETIKNSQHVPTTGTSTRKLDWHEVPQDIRNAIQYLEMRRHRHDDYDPTPYHLYDDTNGEPPISWKERQEMEDKKFREEYGWA